MATLLAEKMFRNYKSSLLRQHRSYLRIYIHTHTSAVLGQVLINYVVLLWVEDGNDRLSRNVGKKLPFYAV